MRTTIEISDEHRARLLELAARRRKKGFSEIIGEALAAYLQAARKDETRCRKALGVRGSLPARDVGQLRKTTTALRASWR